MHDMAAAMLPRAIRRAVSAGKTTYIICLGGGHVIIASGAAPCDRILYTIRPKHQTPVRTSDPFAEEAA